MVGEPLCSKRAAFFSHPRAAAEVVLQQTPLLAHPAVGEESNLRVHRGLLLQPKEEALRFSRAPKPCRAR